jgi:hypothetical protein
MLPPAAVPGRRSGPCCQNLSRRGRVTSERYQRLLDRCLNKASLRAVKSLGLTHTSSQMWSVMTAGPVANAVNTHHRISDDHISDDYISDDYGAR